MERIKSYLIHLLGGITEQEHARLSMLNNLARLHSIKQKADFLYGTPPEVVPQGVQLHNRRNRQYGKTT